MLYLRTVSSAVNLQLEVKETHLKTRNDKQALEVPSAELLAILNKMTGDSDEGNCKYIFELPDIIQECCSVYFQI